VLLASQAPLAAAQLARSSLAEIVESPTPWREAALELLRRRNAVLDTLFYDVRTIADAEAALIAPWLAREGTLVLVPPSGQGPLMRCDDVDDLLSKGGAGVRALAVAGVGSSALGSAAFARNVADALDAPVVAVVSGYGLADLATEAAGGWFWFGTLNQLRHRFEALDDAFRAPLQPWIASAAATSAAAERLLPASLDTRTVCALLSDPRLEFSLVTGHSKGNLVISEALFALEHAGLAQPADDTWIVTISAAITMPRRYTNIVDVMGEVDWFGAMNSRPGVDIEERPRLAWHHTNTELPMHLPVRDVFRDLVSRRGLSLERRPAARRARRPRPR
jgi:hypothetical protein